MHSSGGTTKKEQKKLRATKIMNADCSTSDIKMLSGWRTSIFKNQDAIKKLELQSIIFHDKSIKFFQWRDLLSCDPQVKALRRRRILIEKRIRSTEGKWFLNQAALCTWFPNNSPGQKHKKFMPCTGASKWICGGILLHMVHPHPKLLTLPLPSKTWQYFHSGPQLESLLNISRNSESMSRT